MSIDKLNWKILEELQKNARISFSEIGRKVGLTSPAVAERVKKMEDSGIINSYKVNISPQKTGYQLRAVITLRAFTGRLKAFLETVKTFKEVINCYRITGNENIIMEVILHDQMHLEKLIDRLITYGETRTHIILSNVIEDAPIKQRIGDF
ncbi:Lrp/AsnC family transcriptional regulator [Christiangramia forsetii]|uniref:AsnC/Lrp family transcriptional regulator protein n=2 Tax=Christiangramia forsetii TaxID=411153 RepID=A0LYM4_CHRFK|nr:Lrp/AsnC family transcriptional regulator [Christiangramia forsetii]GGG33820.1 AsnC family transcriptional regulator [Christiangramia forsetii]CAL65469.1 AsnC/Lrp family transcriptional regulator protein [Christiangramia forsetii KT0803]